MFQVIDFLIVNPIVNILFVIYNVVGDFGIAVIIFTIIVKLLMWPLVKRQVEQTRLMRKIQPELTEIRKRCNGNKQMESIQTMDLYKRNNIKPMSSIKSLLIQLPVFFALFLAIRSVATPNNTDANISYRAYPVVAEMNRISDIKVEQDKYLKEVEAFTEKINAIRSENNLGEKDQLTDEMKEQLGDAPVYNFSPKLFGLVDLSEKPGFNSISAGIIMVFALFSAFMQWAISRVQLPKKKKKTTWKKMMEDAKAGKDPNQADMNEFVSGQMSIMMPLMMLVIILQFQGALVLYYLSTNIFTFFQYKFMLGRAEKKMDDATDADMVRKLKKAEKQIKEAEVVENKKTGTRITRISAKDSKSSKKSSKNKHSSKKQSEKG
ncbi:MAG: YidC/Oxa1 family membrane protein insertase [Candidatus Saccharibacteria bacterium]|nr:YidC/Oxa1 family membrane protein insertase [Candidatus Saccharibacteria bacterium]